MVKKLIMTLLVGLLSLPTALSADTVKGRIKYISKKASTIQIDVKGEAPEIIRFDQNTQFSDPKGIKGLGVPDLIKVKFTPSQPATKITKVMFGLPPGVEIDLKQLQKILQGKQAYLLVDARPGSRFDAGHIPTALSIYAKELPQKLDLLPEDKSNRVIFYCGGPTCPFTGEAVRIAQKHGYTNLKGFQAGLPGWKKAKKPVHASASWVAQNLNPNQVLIDVRPRSESSQQHIKTAVAMPAGEFKALTKQFIAEKKAARLPGVSDMGAPIILYGNSDTEKTVLRAYKELKKWQYKNVAILEDGFDDWIKENRATVAGPAPQKITYVRKLQKGAIPREEFAKLEKARINVAFLDVRSAKEAAQGVLKGAIHIPLDDLEANLGKLPKSGELITYCSNGIRSEMGYELLQNKGFNKVRFLNETVMINPDGSYVMD